MERQWAVRKFNYQFKSLETKAKAVKIMDKFFPFALSDLNEFVSVGKIKGHIPMHRDRAQDNSFTGAYYPFHEGMIWNFILKVTGSPALLLGNQNPKVITLTPGMAVWFDITETFHTVIQTCLGHPSEVSEVLLCQVSGHPKFLYQAALKELKELEKAGKND